MSDVAVAVLVLSGIIEMATSWVYHDYPKILPRRRAFTIWTVAAWMMLVSLSSILGWAVDSSGLVIAAIIAIVPSFGLALLNYRVVLVARDQERRRLARWFASHGFVDHARTNFIIQNQVRSNPDLVPDHVWRDLFGEPKPEPPPERGEGDARHD